MDYYFDYRNSNSSRQIACNEDVYCSTCASGLCHYYQGYAEGSSIAGFYVEDFVQLGDDSMADRVKFVFGCHDSETNLFRTQLADGIMGLAFGRGTRGGNTLIDVLFRTHGVATDIFSLCFGLQDGYMTVGGYNSSTHLSELKTAKLYHSIFYAVNLNAISLNDTPVNLSSTDFGHQYESGTIVDSGTTFVYLAQAVYTKVWTSFREFCVKQGNCNGRPVAVSGESHPCYRLDTAFSIDEFFDSFPTLYMTFDNVTVPWEPRSYLFTWGDAPLDFCMGIYSNGGGGSVLGGLFMRGLDIVFDRQHETISFAKSLCNTTAILGEDRRRLSRVAGVVLEEEGRSWATVLVPLAVFVTVGALCIRRQTRRKTAVRSVPESQQSA